jgi:hypothetical protein
MGSDFLISVETFAQRRTLLVALFDVERLHTCGASIRTQRDFLYSLLGAGQQIGAMRFQRLAARVDPDRVLQAHGALFELIDDFFKFGESDLEGEAGDVFIVLRLNGHACQPCSQIPLWRMMIREFKSITP